MKRFKKLAAIMMFLVTVATTVQPASIMAYAQEAQGDYQASEWPEWETVIADAKFDGVNTTNLQVKHNDKIWAASWWMSVAAMVEPGTAEEYTTGWKLVGEVHGEWVTLNNGVQKNVYPLGNSGGNGSGGNVGVIEPGTNFGVGQGVQWPEQVFAPFVDITAYDGNGLNGAPDLKKIAEESGIRFMYLGFMQAHSVGDDRIDWAWGGYAGLSETQNDGWQYEGIKRAIKEFREIGGDVAVSFGGLNTGALWEATKDEALLEKAYMEIIEGYGITRIDFDVEGGIQGYAHNINNARAVKRVQDATGVEVTLTLPVMDFGLTGDGLGTMEAFLDAGVDLAIVNIMTMCYGPSVADYEQGSKDAVENTMKQVQDYYKTYAGITLTDAQAYKKIGTTPSIAWENEGHPFFTVENMRGVVEHAKAKEIGQVSFWSVNRDAQIDGGAGRVQERFEYTGASLGFGGSATLPEVQEPSEEPVEEPIIVEIGMPENVVLVNVSETTVKLGWAKPIEGNAVSYKVYRDGKEVATVTKTEFEDTGLKAGTAYTYTVKAVDADGKSSKASNAVIATTAKEKINEPTDVRVLAVTETTVKIAWTKPEKGTAVSYKVYRDGKEVATVTKTEFEDTGLKVGTAYTYTVKAVDADGKLSKASNAVIATTAKEKISEPTALRVLAVTDTTVKIAWTKPEKGIAVSYKVYRDGKEVATVNRTEFEDTGLKDDTAYTYTVRAVDADGKLSEVSRSSSTRTEEYVTQPTQLRATRITESEVTLEWNPPTHGMVREYQVFDIKARTTTIVRQPRIVITGLTPDSLYMYTVTAVTWYNTVSPQNNISLFTKKEVVTRPENLNLYSVDKNSVTIRWNATNQTDIQGYRIVIDGKEQPIYRLNHPVLSYVIKNITPGERKAVQIQAIGKHGTYSAISSINVRIPTVLEETQIHTAMAGHKGIRTTTSGDVTLGATNNLYQETFHMEHLEGDIYRIWNRTRDKILTRESDGKVRFVTISTGHGMHTSQQWKLIRHADASYIIENVLTKEVLDVNGARNLNGTEIGLWKRNNNLNQRFFLTSDKFDSKIQLAVPTNTKVLLSINNASNLVLNNNANAANTTFYLEKIVHKGNNDYRIWNSTRDSILVKDPAGPGVKFVPANSSNIKDEYWEINRLGEGRVEIRVSGTNLFLDCEGEKTANNTRVLLWQRTGRGNQQFRMNFL